MKLKDVIRAIVPNKTRQFIRRKQKEVLSFLKFYRRYSAAPTGRRVEFAFFRQLINELQGQINNQATPFYAFHVYREMDQLVRLHQGFPRRVLELGPGSSLGALVCFLAGGAERAAGVDIQPIERHPEFYRILKDYLACVAGFRWWRPFAAMDNRPNIRYPDSWERVDVEKLLERVEYFAPRSANDLPFQEGEFDLIYSCAAMEHFDKPQEVVREIRRVLVPGGLTIHEIDLRHHRHADSLGHLRLSEEEYQREAKKYGDGRGIDQILNGHWTGEVFCNRLLASDWKRIFLDEGLQILQFDTLCEVDLATIDPAQYAAPFCARSKNELAPLLIRVVAKRPI